MAEFKPGCLSDDAFTDFPCQVPSLFAEFRTTDGTPVFCEYNSRRIIQNRLVVRISSKVPGQKKLYRFLFAVYAIKSFKSDL